MDAVPTGIRYHSLLPRQVPAVEERAAALFGLYNWRAWLALTWEERAEGVAHYRIHRAIEQHRNETVAREIKRQTAKRGQ